MCGYVVKRMCSPCNGRPVAQAPRTAIGSKEPDVWIHEPTSPHWVNMLRSTLLHVQRSVGHFGTSAPRSVQRRSVCGYVVKRMCSPCNGRPVAQAPRTAIGSKEPDVWIHNPRLRIVVGWMVGRGWMVGWVVSTCVTTRHHTTLGGERLLSLVWFWLFGVWVVGCMVGRVVGTCIRQGALMANPGGDVLVYVYVCVCIYIYIYVYIYDWRWLRGWA